MTIFASRRLWNRPQRLNEVCRRHGVTLTDRGDVIVGGGALVGTYELAGGALVFHDIEPASPLISIFDLSQVD